MANSACFSLLFLLQSAHCAKIWDPDCSSKKCSGSPDRGDGVTSFDDWDGSTRTYSTKITYTCDEGLGFDTTGSPSKIESYCGKKCDGWKGKYSTDCFSSWSDPARCRNRNPDWRHEGGQLPGCTIGEGDAKQATIVMTSFSCLQSRLTPHSDECLCLVQRHRTCPRGNSDYSVLRRLPLSRNSGCDQHPRANPAHNHSTSHSFVL